MIPTRSIYFIKHGELYYVNELSDPRKEWHRGPVPEEIIKLLSKKRTIIYTTGFRKKLRILFENELTSVNEWVMRWNDEFILNPPYEGKQIVRVYGAIPNYDEHPELEALEGYAKSEEFLKNQNDNEIRS